MAIYVFKYSDAGAPSLTSANGTLISVLDFCLVTGMGWEKTSSDTNTATYRASTGNRFYLGVDDSLGTYARVRGFEVHPYAGVTLGANSLGAFPTDSFLSGGSYFYKNTTTTYSDWLLVSDGTMFYLSSYLPQNGRSDMIGFGDFIPYSTYDRFNTCIIANKNTSEYYLAAVSSTINGTDNNCKFIARSISGIGSCVKAEYIADYSKTNDTLLGRGGASYPNVYLNTLNIGDIEISENRSFVRGRLPGLYYPKHPRPLNHDTVVSGSGVLENKQFIYRNIGGHSNGDPNAIGALFFEISDTWRT